ncbi:hypothetical protein [Prochlorococcus sp. ALOHA_ZT_50]|jgi:hypothetical protein|uniref:hypothetical protein n=1 Tax=Prochlorococcus sp. ALOHA_ZT_50 TaxID=2919303 RepID=UPI002580E9F3|nr:hypothetical protein [Prochlorococcus sp. ALOHA_ZT_50]MCH2079636.1 hypothetical protein [Prochlorococcus sp. ALOHA_ZT_50]
MKINKIDKIDNERRYVYGRDYNKLVEAHNKLVEVLEDYEKFFRPILDSDKESAGQSNDN